MLTFSTPYGRYSFRRLPYEIHSASEIFQNTIAEIIEGVQNTVNLQDDIIYASNQEEHDTMLTEVLNRIHQSGLKLNKSKCVFSAAEISFLGHIISVDGLKVDPGKCDAIINMPMPNNKTELQRFLGMINYVGKFIPNLSNITQPLRVLLEKEVEIFYGQASV